jgi:hypothetical protein
VGDRRPYADQYLITVRFRVTYPRLPLATLSPVLFAEHGSIMAPAEFGLERIMPKPLPADTWNNLFYPPTDYRYFENSDRFDFEPGAKDFSWRNAWWLADAALLAYVKNWDDVMSILTTGARFDSVKAIGADAGKSTKGFFASRSGPAAFAVVAFRGTDRDDPRNAATHAETLAESKDGYSVHRGFSVALNQVWDSEVRPALADFIGAHPGAAVYFTGHSLGAALATIAVARFGGGTCGLYTIGSPRVGDDRFVTTVLQKTRPAVRAAEKRVCRRVLTLRVNSPPSFHQSRFYVFPS